MRIRSRWSIAAPVLLLLALVGVAWRPEPAAPPLPSPNGYDDLIAVVPWLTPNPGYARTQDVAELRAILALNSNALNRIRPALAKGWQVPIAFDTNHIARLMKNLSAAKALAGLLAADGRLAELEGRTNAALRAYAEGILLGHLATRGGLMIDELVGIACKAIGMQDARRILHFTDADTTQGVLKTLVEVDRSQETAEAFIARDKDWGIRSEGWLRYTKEALINWKQTRSIHEHFLVQAKRSEAEIRLLCVDAALALHHKENGHYPANLEELVPRPFASVPLDPFSGQPLVYRATTNSYLLYSIGPDRTDDGGKPLTKPGLSGGDILSTPPPAK